MQPRLSTLLVFLTFALHTTFSQSAAAQDSANPSGMWTWKFPNQSAVWTLKLTLKDGKLTGSIKHSQSAPEQPIEDATFKDGVVAFKLRYKATTGGDAVATFTGPVDQRTIKGTATFVRPGISQSRDWVADREP